MAGHRPRYPDHARTRRADRSATSFLSSRKLPICCVAPWHATQRRSRTSGVSAAHLLGLTTQVPGTVEIGAAGKVPEAMSGIRFRLRPYGRRQLGLTPIEVAVLEMLRDPDSAEATWAEVEMRIADLITSGSIRASLITDEVSDERHLGARNRWRALDLVA